MTYFLNEHSLSGQYATSYEFQQALTRVIRCKQHIEQTGYPLFCCDQLRGSPVTEANNFQAEVNLLDRSKKTLILRWFDQANWLPTQRHEPADEYLWNGQPILNSSLAEASCRNFQGDHSDLMSFSPSENFNNTPVVVSWETAATPAIQIEVNNHWTLEQITAALEDRRSEAQQQPVINWPDLIQWGRTFCSSLVLAEYLPDFLRGVPFSASVAAQVQQRLLILNALRAEINFSGTYTGHEIYRQYFVGDRAYFTDESERNKHNFRNEMTFIHPENPDGILFCPWHGKVSTQVFRIHFNWPLVPPTSPLYIVYIGPKITKG